MTGVLSSSFDGISLLDIWLKSFSFLEVKHSTFFDGLFEGDILMQFSGDLIDRF